MLSRLLRLIASSAVPGGGYLLGQWSPATALALYWFENLVGGAAMAMTFHPHPPRVVRPDKAPPLLMTLDQRLEALARAGITCTAVVRFTTDLSHWQPETFVQHALVDWLRVAEVWVGANFLFGHDRSGNFTLLRSLGRERIR